MKLPTITLLFVLTLLFSCGQSPKNNTRDTKNIDSAAQAKIQEKQLKKSLLKLYEDGPGEIRYFYNSIDLNKDGKREWVAYVVGPLICGSGGCNTLVFSPKGNKLQLIANISVSNPPVIATQHATNGWLDLVVGISGGGLQSATYASLQFNGTTYPSNPTMAPTVEAKDFQKKKELIKPFDYFKDGHLLRKGEGNP